MINKKLKVLYITVRSDIGGGPKHVFDLCSHIEGVEVYIAAPKTEPYGEKYKKLATSFYEIPHRKMSLGKLFGLLLFCKENGINTVHSHGRGAGVYSRFLALFGLKVIHTFHGVHGANPVEKFFKYLTKKFICVSNSERNNAVKFNLAVRNQVEVIPNGIDLDEYKDITSPGKNVLGTISRLDPHKNNIELIRFMRELPDYTLLIAGDGEEMDYLRAEAPDNVTLLGEVSDIKGFLAKIDIYVSASKGEGLPYSVLEAMAADKPILLSRVVGHIDLTTEKNLYSTDEEFMEKLKNTPAYDRELYSIEKMCNEIGKVYG